MTPAIVFVGNGAILARGRLGCSTLADHSRLGDKCVALGTFTLTSFIT